MSFSRKQAAPSDQKHFKKYSNMNQRQTFSSEVKISLAKFLNL